MVFGRKKSEEKANRDLLEKVWHKLPWAKEGFVWQDDTWVPIDEADGYNRNKSFAFPEHSARYGLAIIRRRRIEFLFDFSVDTPFPDSCPKSAEH